MGPFEAQLLVFEAARFFEAELLVFEAARVFVVGSLTFAGLLVPVGSSDLASAAA